MWISLNKIKGELLNGSENDLSTIVSHKGNDPTLWMGKIFPLRTRSIDSLKFGTVVRSELLQPRGVT